MRNTLFAILVLFVAPASASGLVPPLPDGLQESKKQETRETPALPLGPRGAKAPPSLPPGLGGEQSGDDRLADVESWADKLGIHFSGFGEVRAGLRLQNDPHEKAASIGEARFQLSLEKDLGVGIATLTTDAVFDPVLDDHQINLETGNGWIDLREASFLMRPTSFADLKIGRQTLTWGTGDLLFINDMFPKDWNAFFIGRDEEYLKAPSDALKLSLFSEIVNLDMVYTPRFDADRYIDGKRLSYFNTSLSSPAGQNAIVVVDRPSDWFSDDELAFRLYRNIGNAEVALYYYGGFWKSPAGQNQATGLARFPRLRSYGISVRRPILGGIAHTEIGYYDSLEDSTGANIFTANSELRLLIGYEHELAPDLTGAAQYYQERLASYASYIGSLPVGTPARDKIRHVLTARLTKLSMNQTVTWSLFFYYSPNDGDGYFRPKVSRKVTDNWTAEIGANIFFGAEQYTFFGQFARNSNGFVSLRRGF